MSDRAARINGEGRRRLVRLGAALERIVVAGLVVASAIATVAGIGRMILDLI